MYKSNKKINTLECMHRLVKCGMCKHINCLSLCKFVGNVGKDVECCGKIYASDEWLD